MKSMIIPAACLVAFACAGLFVPVASAQDMAKTAGKNVKVLVDNDKIRVLELTMPPGASTGMHSHGDNWVYFITGGEATQTKEGGKPEVATRKAGESLWSGPVVHDTVNSGKNVVKTLVVEVK
ncbi:hypothetical protein [Lysobacter sp. GCM10012299]|uniref:hypothetical protein n=1 Tax=Lysobacter sp. GCM10012299 TaxID=3317333 RepID=UPI0036192794